MWWSMATHATVYVIVLSCRFAEGRSATKSFCYIVISMIISPFSFEFGLKIILAVSKFHSDCIRSKCSSNIREYVNLKKRSESTELQCSETTF